MRLLELCLSPDLGGLELYMVRAAKALDDEMEVLSVISTQSKLEQYYEETTYDYQKIPRTRTFSFSTARRLAKIIDAEQVDVIHMHWTKDLPVAVMAKMLSKRKPKLVQTRNMTMTRFKDDFYHRFLYAHMDMILPVTHQVAEQIRQFIPEKVRPKVEVLYMGSDKPVILDETQMQAYKEEIGVTPGEFVIGMVGRIEEVKGQYLLIEAVERLKQEGVKVKVFFVGHAMEESYQEELQMMVIDKALSEQVVFLGFTKDPHRFMQACDALVLATECETFGLVLIEAMQVGTAVIATDQCGPLEIIEHEKSGLLFKAKDSDDLAVKIKRLTDDSSFCTSLAENGKQVAETKFSNTGQFKRLEGLLKALA